MERFRDFIEKVMAHGLSPREHEKHPDLGLLLDGLSGDLPPDMRSRLAAHLATCPRCLSRWRKLRELLWEEQRTLESKARLVSLPELLREREKARLANRIRLFVDSVLGALRPRPALAFATALASFALLVFGVTYPFLKGANERISSLTQEVASLRTEIRALTQGFGIPSRITLPPSREELSRFVEEAGKIRDPWQRSLFVAAFLNSYGISIPEDLDLGRTRPYTVRQGDTWEVIAERELGDKALWTILYLLNVKEAPTGKLSPGQEIKIPQRK